MSSYHSSFTYLDKNSSTDFNLIISHFDADSGESETGLSTESIYSESADGTSRNLYGTKYTGAEPVRITLIKQDGSNFSVNDNRSVLKWLTGAKMDSWLDLYVGNELKYRMKGHVQNVLQYKMDARVIGFIVVFELASPFAFSILQKVEKSTKGDGTDITIKNPSDDVHNYTYMKTTYTKGGAKGDLVINNKTTNETTTVKNLALGETVTLYGNQMITSDKSSRVFGSDFNFVFPKLRPGTNEIEVKSTGSIVFEYYYAIKIGDCAIDINAISEPICDEDGNIQIERLDWSRISNTPNTLSGYGITDAYTTSAVYNKNEVDQKISKLTNDVRSASALASDVSSNLTYNYYNKTYIDSNYHNKAYIDGKYCDKELVNNEVVELRKEIDSQSSQLYSLLMHDYYNKTYVDDNYYNKAQVDHIVSQLTYDPTTGTGAAVTWSQILDKPTTLSGLCVKTEVQDMIDVSVSAVKVDIDEYELNAMLIETLAD